MSTTSLSSILTRMSRYQTLDAISELYKVQDIDEAIREIKRDHNLPFLQKRGSLRVFPDVLLYPPATDHNYLIYLDTNNQNVQYGNRMRARYTSLQQFYEDLDYRNTVAEIWDGNSMLLAIRDKNVPPGFYSGSTLVDLAESISNYTASDDASALVLDTVLFTGDSNASVQFLNTVSSGTATITIAPQSLQENQYQQKYFFVSVFLSGLPTSVVIRYGNDSSNYLSTTVTTQFSGQPFTTNSWNLLAIDLSTATTTGTIDSDAFDYAVVALVGAPAGYYNIDASYLRGWTLLDYWYISKWIVQTSTGTAASKESFIAANGTYSTDDLLVGDYEWADVVMYKAMIRSLADKENDSLKADVMGWLAGVMDKLRTLYPDAKPLMITQSDRYQTDYLGADYCQPY